MPDNLPRPKRPYLVRQSINDATYLTAESRRALLSQAATTLQSFLPSTQPIKMAVDYDRVSGPNAKVEALTRTFLQRLKMVLQPDEQAAAQYVCTLFVQNAIDIEELLQAHQQLTAAHSETIAERNGEIQILKTRVKELQTGAESQQTRIN